jgi:zinc transport system substrate-binding protein
MKIPLLQLLILFLLLSSCGMTPELQTGRTVSVSIQPQKYFVRAITGDSVSVNVMIPPGASHSSYEPTARQMNLLVNSDAYLRIGQLDFELAWMPRFTGINPSLKTFDLSEGIDLIQGLHEHHGGVEGSADERGIDPHIWMSPANVRIMAKNILNAMVSLYPADSGYFRGNYNTFIQTVDSVISLYEKNARVLEGRSFIIYHPALAYLARDYKMKQVVLEFDGKEPPPAHIRQIIDLAREQDIHTVFVQKQFSIDNSRSLASEIDADIIRIDPMDEDWKGQMVYILDLLLTNRHKTGGNK